MNKVRIEKIIGMQIFDSRGTPTVEANVILSNGIEASAAVPSGASTGKYEAYELRDTGISDYGGKGVINAVNNINTTITRALQGELIKSQQHLDGLLIDLDGTETKMHLGANAVLAVSLALAKVGARLYNMPLYQYIGGINGTMLPLPMMNILNGGAHANNNVDIQEFMIVPTGAADFEDAMKMGTEVYKELGKVLKENNFATSVGDEGGYAPNLESDESALELIVYAIGKAGYKPGKDIKIALDIASSEWYEDGVYTFPKKKIRKSGAEMIDYYTDLCARYPIVSIEDPFSEDDFGGFATFTKKLGKKTQVVGDDLFVTNTARLKLGINQKCGNAILIKPNQIGTLTETMQVVQLAKHFGYGTIISHRSGETEDTSIADIAVALNAGQIKTGAPARTDRVCKYNRLLRIERELGIAATYGPYTS